jgi:TolB-like protein
MRMRPQQTPEVRVFKSSSWTIKRDTPLVSPTEAEFEPSQVPLPKRPPLVVAISGERGTAVNLATSVTESRNSAKAQAIESPVVQDGVGIALDEPAIREELRRILASKALSRAVQMSYLLEWIVNRWLAGDVEQLNGRHILMAVFHLSTAFQESFDSTGRVYVGRLRSQFERYYGLEGAKNHVRLEIPVGKYIPIACHHSPSKRDNHAVGHSATNTVMVLPFQLASNSQTNAGPAPLAVTDDLSSRLTRTRQIRVTSRVSTPFLDYRTDVRILGQHFGAHFIVEGTVDQTVETCDLTVHLSETTGGYNIWTGHYQAMAVSHAFSEFKSYFWHPVANRSDCNFITSRFSNDSRQIRNACLAGMVDMVCNPGIIGKSGLKFSEIKALCQREEVK